MKPKGPSRTHRGTHPDMRSDQPGRIPESLINAAIDGELNDDMQREIAQALNYDTVRKQELIDTADAINALQMPISTPDFSQGVLERADRHRRFIPATWRKHVRAGRLGIAAMVLVTLLGVAGLQNMYPRLTTLASHPTPVNDIECAIEEDASMLATAFQEEAKVLQASVNPFDLLSGVPGRTDHRVEFTLTNVMPTSNSNTQLSGRVGLVQSSSRLNHQLDCTGVYLPSQDSGFASAHTPMRFVAAGFYPGYRSSHSGFAESRLVTMAYVPSAESQQALGLKRVILEIDVPDLP